MPCASSTLLILTEGGGWEPGIGDPTVFGWATVLAYMGAAYACHRARAAVLVQTPGAPRLASAWFALTVGLALLGINKQLDLQSLVTVVGRRMALHDGWYEHRRLYQVWFIRLALAGSAFGTVCAGWWLRRHIRELWLAAVGGGFLLAFVVIRAASFHHVDLFLRMQVAGVPINALLELGGIACVGVAARLAAKHGAR